MKVELRSDKPPLVQKSFKIFLLVITCISSPALFFKIFSFFLCFFPFFYFTFFLLFHIVQIFSSVARLSSQIFNLLHFLLMPSHFKSEKREEHNLYAIYIMQDPEITNAYECLL